MSTVTLRHAGVTIKDVTAVGDRSTDEALAYAQQLCRSGVRGHAAYIDRVDGVVIITSDGRRFHFETPLCGYDGTGPRTTAKLLRIFKLHSTRWQTQLLYKESHKSHYVEL